MAYNLSNCLNITLQSFTTYFLTVMSVRISNKCNYNCVWTQFQDKAPADVAITAYDWGRLAPALFTHLLVALEDRRSDKSLLAQVALVLLVAVVHHLDVDVERVLPLEGGITLVTLECSLTCSKEKMNICKSHFNSAIVKRLNTDSSRTTRGDPISPGLLCGQITTKKTQTTIF